MTAKIEPSNTETSQAAALGAMLADPQFVNGIPFVVIPESAKCHSLEEMLSVPARVRDTVILQDAASFISYFLGYARTQSKIFLDKDTRKFVAIIDYHETVIPAWKSHRCEYTCKHSREWATWLAMNGKRMNQAEFARFIEDNLIDICEPSGAEMMELATSMEITKDVSFHQSVRLSNGQIGFAFNEQIRGCSKNMVEIPSDFKIGIPCFEAGDAYRITCRFRWSLQEGGKLMLSYDILRPHKIVEVALAEVTGKIAGETGRGVLIGTVK